MKKTQQLPPEIANYRLNESVGYLLGRARLALTNVLNQRTTAQFGVTHMQACILFTLATGKCTAAVNLAREHGIDASAVTRLIDQLEKRELLSRVRCQEDRRVTKLQLTAKGHALAAQLPPVFKHTLGEMLDGFTSTEVDQFKDMLSRILTNAEQHFN
jgi:DNA-binding MarR family transcriptional regulator